MIKSLDKLDKKDREIIYNLIEEEVLHDKEKNKFFMQACKMKPVKNPSFEKVEYISEVEGRIKGYFAYLHDKINQKVINIEIIGFDDMAILTRDFIKFCKHLDDKFKYIELAIIPEAPTYRLARYLFKKYNFRKIGTLESSIRLINNTRYDVEIWHKRGDKE